MNKTINFSKVPCFTDITKSAKAEYDLRYDFANAMYMHGNGVAMGVLAMKIYNSKGDEEYSEEEQQLILAFSNSLNPIIRDSLAELINS